MMSTRTRRRVAPRATDRFDSPRRAQLLALWRRTDHEPVAADAIYATLREAILRGILPAGEPLAEVQLTTLFNHSRTPVREAILRLESEHLAVRSSRRGFVIGRITREQVLEVYAVREVLDGLAARLAAQGILPGDLDHLRWLNSQMREPATQRDVAAMLEINIEFHEAVCQASRNSLLLQMTRQIHDWVRRFPDTTFSYAGRALEAVEEHEAVLDAIARRDSETAERMAREQVVRAKQVRVAMLQSVK